MIIVKNEKFVFLILHYQAINETIKSANLILEKYKNYDFNIIIVDNCSPNKTGQILLEKYSNNEKIEVILNNKNLGFSKGNNIGFKYAKSKLNPDFIIMMNSDIYMIQDNFLELISREYQQSHFAVLGPKIHLPQNKINYIKSEVRTKNEIKKRIIELVKQYVATLFFIDKKESKKKINSNNKNINKSKIYNAVIHGCCMVFSKRYIDLFDGLDEKTFMYGEEELLNIKLKKSNLLSVYAPELEVFHNEDSSTNEISKSNRKVKLFKLKYMIIANIKILHELGK